MRAASWSIVAICGVLAATELSLQAIDRATGDAIVGRLKLQPGSAFHGGIVNRHGYWDEEFETSPRPGRFRVAAIGSSVPLSGTSASNCLALLERRVPGIEVYNFGVPEIGPSNYAAQLKADVAGFRPDLVLAFISIGDDITTAPLGAEAPSAFDWRSLRSLQWIGGTLGLSTRIASPCDSVPSAPADYEGYLRHSAHRLAICRTPIEPAMHQRWRQTMGHLDGLVRACRRRSIAVALVLVPSEFQVCPGLCETLSRRVGYEANQIDLELPQRRLAGFAHERSLPVLDLLPHFRASASSPYNRHQCQLSDHGNQLVTETIGGWLQTRFGGERLVAGK
jgi:hypothetical protein